MRKPKTKQRRRVGRPKRAAATKKALAALSVDPASIDPRSILASIAADVSAPASARVQACRALISGPSEPKRAEAGTGVPDDDVTQRALHLMNHHAPDRRLQ